MKYAVIAWDDEWVFLHWDTKKVEADTVYNRVKLEYEEVRLVRLETIKKSIA